MIDYYVNARERKTTISKEIYGQFSEHLGRCIYGGLFVGANSPIPNVHGIRCDVVQALRKIHVPILRWPGGCFADEYHWKDGIGPLESRKKMINTHWGGVVEDNSFGTHEFFELCRQLGCEPYVNGNVGSGTVAEMNELVEYITSDGRSPMADLRRQNGRKDPWHMKYFAVGNENWGCGGNMLPDYYANEYRRYQTYVRNYGDNRIYKIACGPSGEDYEWTDTLMRMAGRFMDGLSLHYYTVPGQPAGQRSATRFDEPEYYDTLARALRMDAIVTRHDGIMSRYDPEKRVALVVDEWGSWYDVEPGTNPGFLYQQNTMRDALVAGVTLNIFNKHSDRVRVANIAQMINVLQSVILTDGAQMLCTPTYHVFDLYQCHQDATLLGSFIDTPSIVSAEHTLPAVHESASVDAQGHIHVTLCNLSASQPQDIRLHLAGRAAGDFRARIVQGTMDTCNTFEAPDTVQAADYDGVSRADDGFTIRLPACAVMELTVD